MDSGDLLYPSGFDHFALAQKERDLAVLKGDLYLQTYNLMGYDAYTPGEVDLSRGVAELKKMSRKAKFAFLLANLQDLQAQKPVFTPYLIKEMGGIRVGVFGLLSSRFSENLHPPDKKAFKLTDPLEAARQVIGELKKKQCKVIVAAAHMEESEQKKLAETFREVYFVVSGHARSLKEQPMNVNNAQILAAGTRGEYLGQMDFFLKEESDGTHVMSHYQVIALRDSYGDHPQTAKLVDKFRADSKPLYLAESKSPSPEKDPSMENRTYAYPVSNFMGDQSCVPCHQPQHDSWKKTGHSKAYQTLVRNQEVFRPHLSSLPHDGIRGGIGFPGCAGERPMRILPWAEKGTSRERSKGSCRWRKTMPDLPQLSQESELRLWSLPCESPLSGPSIRNREIV